MKERLKIVPICFLIFTFFSYGNGQVSDREGPYKDLDLHKKNTLQSASVNDNPLLDDYDVKFYKLDVEADTVSDYIAGNVSILVEVVNNPLSTLVLELINELTIDLVRINGTKAMFSHTNDEINITLPELYAVGEMITAEVIYSGKTGSGMFTRVDPNWNIAVTATLSEPFYAKDWFPCKQRLEDKADSVHVFITTPFGLKAASNGLLTGTTYLPNGKIRHEWKSNYPIAFYLISIAVSDYIEYNIQALPEGGDPILIQNYIYNVEGCLEYYKDGIDMTIPIMEAFTDMFGPFPFREEKYGHYLWPWGGGMEHQTMSGMGGFSFFLVAHELGHSWFGDYVTCATWQDIWINEGFATLAGYLATERIYPAAADGERVDRFERALREANGSVFVPAAFANSDSRIFSSNLSYNKGMAILHMIRFIVDDDELFFLTLRNFLDAYADSVATGLDFRSILEETTGINFSGFFQQWYFGYGYPIFNVSWSQEGSNVTLYSNQTTSSDMTTFFRTPMEYKLKFAGGDTTIRVEHTVNNEVYTLDIEETILGIDVDPNNHVLDQVESVKQLAGVETFTQHFSIYPNPSKDYFIVSPQEEWKGKLQVVIINDLNQVVYRETIEHSAYDKHVIRPGIGTAGLYFLRIISGKQVETHKIIIN